LLTPNLFMDTHMFWNMHRIVEILYYMLSKLNIITEMWTNNLTLIYQQLNGKIKNKSDLIFRYPLVCEK